MSDIRADWLAVEGARAAILAAIRRLPPVTLPLLDALGHVLAERIAAPLDLPAHANSGMDGFAVRSADVVDADASSPIELRVIEDVAAGAFPTLPLTAGTAIRVMTGAPVPQGADSVIRVEHTDGGAGIGTDDARVRVLRPDDVGRNIRPRGEDMRAGQTVLSEGMEVGAGEIGLAAAVGRSQLEVYRRPLIGIVSSGDELVEVDGFSEVLAGRRTVASNGYALEARAMEARVAVRRLGTAADDADDLRARILAAHGCDALVTSAGISVGAHDHTREVLEQLGTRIEFWRVRMRPGSPFAFGRVEALGGIPWFGLPGNPVSAMVTFEIFVRPALLAMAGHEAIFPPVITAVLEDNYITPPGLTHFARVQLIADEDGFRARLTGAQGSGRTSSMVGADGLVIVPEASTGVRAGERVRAIVLRGAPLRSAAGF